MLLFDNQMYWEDELKSPQDIFLVEADWSNQEVKLGNNYLNVILNQFFIKFKFLYCKEIKNLSI